MSLTEYYACFAGWFSLNVPSGLTIYWFINNVLSTAQQVCRLPYPLLFEVKEGEKKGISAYPFSSQNLCHGAELTSFCSADLAQEDNSAASLGVCKHRHRRQHKEHC